MIGPGMATRRRQIAEGVIGVVAVLAVLVGFLGPFVYIHFIEGPAPAKLELPSSSASTTTSPAQGSNTISSSLEGTWNVGTGSTAGYRVQEVLVGQSATAVGRTNKIWGSLTIAGSMVTKGTFTTNMATVVSDQSQRNARFVGPIMDVSRYPTATLTLLSPISLDGPCSWRRDRGTTPSVTSISMAVTKAALLPGPSSSGWATRSMCLRTLRSPSPIGTSPTRKHGGFVTTANTGTLEVLLHLTQGPATAVRRHRPARPVRLAGAPSPCRAPRFRRSPSLRVSHPIAPRSGATEVASALSQHARFGVPARESPPVRGMARGPRPSASEERDP